MRTYSNREWHYQIGHSTNGNIDQPDWEHRDYSVTYSVSVGSGSNATVTVTDRYYGTTTGTVDLRSATASSDIQRLISSMVNVGEYGGNKNYSVGAVSSGTGTRNVTVSTSYNHTSETAII